MSKVETGKTYVVLMKNGKKYKVKLKDFLKPPVNKRKTA